MIRCILAEIILSADALTVVSVVSCIQFFTAEFAENAEI